MKKKKINSLTLNKKTVSNLSQVKGGKAEIVGLLTVDKHGIICRSIEGQCEDSLAPGCVCSAHVCN